MPITTTGSIVYFKDDLGQPLIGGKVYTYEYSTSKPKDTYKTAVRELPHTNPVILNDSGSVEWYLKGDYTIRVYTSEDVFVEEFDIVTPSKVQVDEVSESLNLLKSELKNAAYHDTGTAAAQVPLNSDLGTAAYKNVGIEAGNVMEVGAFGLGGTTSLLVPATTPLDQLPRGFISIDGNAAITYGQHYGELYSGVLRLPTAGDVALEVSYWGADIAGVLAGDLKTSPKITTLQIATKDASGNMPVASIQAGVDAPKIAYKKFVLPIGTTSVAHGLDRDKILYIHGTYLNGSERYPYTGAKANATILDAAPTSIFERHILITYEV